MGIGAAVFVLAALLFFANRYVKNEIQTALEEEFSQFEYEDISVNVLGGNTTIKNPRFRVGKFSIEAENFRLRDLHYSNYISNGDILIGKIGIINPRVVHNKNDSVPATNPKNENDVQRKFLVKELEINGGALRMVENDSATNHVYLSLRDLFFHDLQIDSETRKGGLPFKYGRIEMETDSLFLEMNEEHNIVVQNIFFENQDLSIEGFQIIPKYNRREFDRIIPFEKDHVQLKIEEINVTDLRWGIENDTLQLSSPYAKISTAQLQIYRNKMLADDMRLKPLYSKMLRELGMKLQLDSVEVERSRIVYEENVAEDRPPGKVIFGEVKAVINNLSNTGFKGEEFPDTVIEATALFQERSTLTLDWKFNVQNENDEFTVSGRFEGISADAMNSFLTPVMNVEVEGEIKSIAYNFYGDPNIAGGDMRLSYSGFKVNLLDGGERKGILSWFTNLVLKNDVVDEDIRQENIKAERDKTKSFWNYLWLCIRNGALKTFL